MKKSLGKDHPLLKLMMRAKSSENKWVTERVVYWEDGFLCFQSRSATAAAGAAAAAAASLSAAAAPESSDAGITVAAADADEGDVAAAAAAGAAAAVVAGLTNLTRNCVNLSKNASEEFVVLQELNWCF